MSNKPTDKYAELETALRQLPHINTVQVEQWVSLQKSIDATRDYLIRAVPQARFSIDEAQKILAQRTYTLVFFGGTGVGKSTLINALLGRNLLPTGAVTAVTGTIVYVEQAAEGEAESLVLTYWTEGEFAERVRRLCQLSEVESFDITNDEERKQAHTLIDGIIAGNKQSAKTERDEYLEILLDCIATYESHRGLFVNGVAAPKSLPLENEQALKNLREDGFKGSSERQIRLVRSAAFRIQPRAGIPNMLMNGYLRIVDVPGLGAGMRLHEAITLEEMKREDAMIALVTDAGRQRVDEMKSLSAVNWIKENRLKGLTGSDLDEAAAKIFLVVNGGNVRQAFDRLNSGLPEAELEVREVTRYIAPNYWERYKERGNRRPYFLVMAPPAVYLQDPDHAPTEFASETERIAKVFKDHLGNVDITDPLHPDTKAALLNLSEVPALREKLVSFIQTERVRGQLREAASRIRNALHNLRIYYEQQLANRGIYPPFTTSWEVMQERRFENLLLRQQKILPRALHDALLELNHRTNNDQRFRDLLHPTLTSVQRMVQESVQREVEILLESYGTTYWDERDVMYDNLVWGTAGIEVPIKRILYQVELVMQEAISQFMPEIAEIMSNELQRTLDAHEILSRLQRTSYGQTYSYTLPELPGQGFTLEEAYNHLVSRVSVRFREVCRQASMYEMMRPERSIHHRLEAGNELALADNERVLDIALRGPEEIHREVVAEAQAIITKAQTTPAASQPIAPAEDAFEIKILDQSAQPTEADFAITFPGEEAKKDQPTTPALNLETSYADKLESIGQKTREVFQAIITDMFSDDDLLPRLRRLFWLEATKAERDFNNHIVKPMLRQHDRKLHDPELRTAMEIDLESVSDVEELMRVWEGLHKLEMNLAA